MGDQNPPSIRLWRIYDHQAPWARSAGYDPLDGSGGLYTSSRWNRAGTRMVYLASSPSLAILETLAHINPTEFGERKLLQLEITAPTIERVSPTVLLQMLRDAPPHDLEVLTRQFGSQWALEGSSLLLEVPSMVVPIEKNYLLNPLHPETNRVRIIQEEIVRLDWRIANWAQPDL